VFWRTDPTDNFRESDKEYNSVCKASGAPAAKRAERDHEIIQLIGMRVYERADAEVSPALTRGALMALRFDRALRR
jgi:hypothetical protein